MENTWLNANNKTDIQMHPRKQSIMAFRTPNALEIQPEKNPPLRPPAPNNIMVRPRSECPSDAVRRLCTQVGSHENIAHNPISMVPKITTPLKRFDLTSSVNFTFPGEEDFFDSLH